MSEKVTLHQFAPAYGIPNASPFCLKVETFLKLTGIDYETKVIQNPGSAPKGKLPFITHMGKDIADSSFILEYLREKFAEKVTDFPTISSPCEHAIRIMLEEHLLFAGLRYRWLDDRNWKSLKNNFFSLLPAPAKGIAPSLVRRKMKRDLAGQGMGRFNDSELLQVVKKDMVALADYLGDRHFFSGDRPGDLDCTAFGMLANVYCVPNVSEFSGFVRSISNLQEYTKRVGKLAFEKEFQILV